MVFVLSSIEVSLTLAQGTAAIAPTTGAGGLGTTVTMHDHTFQITGGTRPGNGTNLFHSFDQFNVGRGDTAQFLNTTPSLHTTNILGRVTGENPSSIFGTIDTMSYPGANLFLMNPAGIVFGPHAALNVGGSVAFTTANYLRLADGNGSNAGILHAESTATSLLTSASVAAFGFLGSNPAAIAVLQGSTLTVQPGQSISLVGGNHGFSIPDANTSARTPDGTTVTGGHLRALGGQINMVSVASPGEILAGTLDHAPNINGQSFGALGTVQISKQASIDTSNEGGGTILIRGGRLVVDDSTISANTRTAGKDTGTKVGPSGSGIDIQVTNDAVINNGALVETNVESGASHGSGGIRITANNVTISGGPKVRDFVKMNPDADIPFGIRSNIGPGSTAAKSGDISLNATSFIQITDVGHIETRTSSTGKAGDVTLKASGDIRLDSNATVFSESNSASGDSGNIMLSSSQGNVRVTDAGVTSQTNNSSGNAGNIKLDVRLGDVFLDKASVFNRADGTGTLGGIQINAHNLILRDGSFIVGNNFSNQVPGNILITLNGQLTLKGGSAISTEALGPANAANLIVKASDILIAGGSFLFTGVDPGSSGAGGAIDLSARSLTIQNGGEISAETSGTSPHATGGSIVINTADRVTMTNHASITASSEGGAGDAGNIKINAGQQLDMHDDSSITTTTQSAKANGGNIDIRAIDRVRLVNNSEISTSVKGAEGSGGNIFIDPNVVILNGSNVTAEAVGGAGGNITFVTPVFLTDLASRVSATSQRGASGTVNILSPLANLSSMVGQLVSKTSPAQVLLQNRCVALAGGEQSTFIVAGRDSLPSEPGEWLSSPLSMDHLTGHDMEHAAVPRARGMGLSRSPAIVSSVDETHVLSLRRLTPPGFLVRTFATGPTGCPS